MEKKLLVLGGAIAAIFVIRKAMSINGVAIKTPKPIVVRDPSDDPAPWETGNALRAKAGNALRVADNALRAKLSVR